MPVPDSPVIKTVAVGLAMAAADPNLFRLEVVPDRVLVKRRFWRGTVWALDVAGRELWALPELGRRRPASLARTRPGHRAAALHTVEAFIAAERVLLKARRSRGLVKLLKPLPAHELPDGVPAS